jgi:PAT family beta-lactamase induction signal transducer AmpG
VSSPDSRPDPARRGAFQNLVDALTSWRTLSVSLLSFSSGLPLALVWIAIPYWMRSVGVDIRIVGLFTLAQAPWTFKILWSPLMDRYTPPFLGRRRGWAAIAQIALLVLTLMLAGVGDHPDSPWIVLALTLAIAFASATQDIAIDAYAVDVLRKDEQGVAVGLRTAIYRAAMFVAGGVAITVAGRTSWVLVNIGLAVLYLPMLVVTRFAPEPEEKPVPPRSLKDAVWLPFLEILGRHRALEILAFVVLYKLADNLAQSLLRPFLYDMGYSSDDIGVVLATVGLIATLVGVFLGGAATTVMGLGHSLWIFGFLQVFSNVGYILVAQSGINRPLMFGAMAFETFTTGLGTGAFSVLLLRMTRKRFSATQYALFSSLFALPRIFAGPVAGFTEYSIGWTWFFWGTIVAGIPGLILLARFCPLGVRDPEFVVEPPKKREPVTVAGLIGRGAAGLAIGTGLAALFAATLTALEIRLANPETGFDLGGALESLMRPAEAADWIAPIGIIVVGLFCGLFTAAVTAARHGATTR